METEALWGARQGNSERSGWTLNGGANETHPAKAPHRMIPARGEDEQVTWAKNGFPRLFLYPCAAFLCRRGRIKDGQCGRIAVEKWERCERIGRGYPYGL